MASSSSRTSLVWSSPNLAMTRGFAALALAQTVVRPKYESNCFSSATSSKVYSINHRTFRNEFSVYSNVLRVIRNIAVPTQMCSLEFKTELDRFDVNMERWRETYEMYEEAMWEANGNAETALQRILEDERFDATTTEIPTMETLREMETSRPRFPLFPWQSWKRLVARGCIRDASISSCRVVISKYLEERTTRRLAVKLTKEAKMSGKRKMGRFHDALVKRRYEFAASSSSSNSMRRWLSDYYGINKLTLTKKFAKTHALANFCNFSACWVYDMFEDLLRCYNFYRLGGYIGHPVPENEASLASCLKLYANCCLKHTATALSTAFASAAVAGATFYAFPTLDEGKGVYYALFFTQLLGDQLGLKLGQFVNGKVLGARGLPRFAEL
ncbi:unnamed protein product [Bathycoccus prasinos]